MDVMEETLFLRRLSCDGLRFLAINRIESNRTKDEMNECFIYGLSDGGSIEVYQSNKHLLSFKVSELKGMLGLEWIIPFRVYFTKNVHILNICKEHLALAYVFMEWDTSSSCYILHFMIQSDNQTRVKVKNISLGFLGNKKLEKWNLSMEPNPLLWLSTRDGMVILIDMERCQHIGNIVLTKTESDKGLIDFLSFDNRAVAVWKDAPGLIHLWQNLHM
ncbi:uncharacterized protein Gasu_61410 [Galdieria sulphuraria]|uniref:Uncharacterized protein n=1 Tax=Galdieria sulphuraria TaxID=130081 RepID=M2XS11_GALSU|nr:uncharacterized protein Gasu_61410 [Galdieria sulphuraria]EME26214.1 hypothetical protein Gasu_61410 [Galdieria sulphuraria]|eukprot:XP_005702734.1 hypothetical protein Gasu_61410 [Galdieria sulphuraria]